MTEGITPGGAGKRSMYFLYWAGYLVLFSLVQGFPAGKVPTAFFNELFSLLPKVVFVLLVVEWSMDAFFLKKRIRRFVLVYTLLVVLFAFLLRLIDNYIILNYFLTDWAKEPLLSVAPFLYNAIKLQFVVTVPFSIKLFHYWAQEKSRVQAIEAEKMRAELNSMRNQFHPHFLFNVLNGLYSKVLAKSDDAPEMLLQISSLLRFSVYEANDQIIPLEKEIQYLRSYIALQQTRFSQRLDVSFTVTGEVGCKKIEPFLMMPFIENSFKHSLHEAWGKGWVTIYITIQEEWLTLKVENSLPPQALGVASSLEDSSGFGIRNVKKRLAHLYPTQHTLLVTETAQSYFVSLKMKLYAGT